MKNYFYIIFVSLCLVGCKKKKVSFVSLTQFETIDTVFVNNEMNINKQLLYLINDYNDSDETSKLVDSCAYAVAGKNPAKFTNFKIIFYKVSDITNISHLRDNPRDIDRYSQEHDMLYSYDWINGKFAGKSYMKN